MVEAYEKLTREDVYDMINGSKEGPQASLTNAEVQSFLEQVRDLASKQFGITLVTDYNGQYGDAGATYMTLRTNDAEATFKLMNVTDNRAEQNLRDIENCWRGK
ncbi:hypothetical protein H1O16_gp352 [Burkholderia phage BcepSaruman]|uniref:Uncharacterized protein n=1 Tax=Burkholderia phage BcepSaruman TaxID=2530032 RepID=A0A4D5ZCI9_9CAUD|nr:hypothetical protein H1O16_gp352 [Burkholderia phage BcepSaruman]QBX06765.1 hypothetical protein BcepSaruman_352 [Burkholderia phage BcepSaruman]